MTRAHRRTRRLIVAGSALMLLALSIVAIITTRSLLQADNLHEARAEGLAAFEAGDVETALTKLSNYLKSRPDDVRALMTFAEARATVPAAGARHLTDAIAAVNHVLTLAPQDADALALALRLHEQAGHRVESREVADRLLTLDANHIDALRVTATAALADRDLDVAGDASQRLIAIEPIAIDWRSLHLDVLRAADADVSQLLSTCDDWIAEHDDDADGRFHLLKARVLASMGRIEHARQEATRAAAAGTQSHEIFEQLITLLDALHLQHEADELVTRIRNETANARWVLAAVAHRLWQADRIDEAVAALEQAGEIVEREPTLLRWQCLLNVLANNAARAEVSLRDYESKLDDTHPHDAHADRAWITAMRAWLQRETQGVLPAINACGTALSHRSNDAALHYLVGIGYASLGEHELASVSLDQARRLSPHWRAARLACATAHEAAGDSQRAMQLLREGVVQSDGRDLTQLLMLTEIWLDAGAPDEHRFVDTTPTQSLSLPAMLSRVHEHMPDNERVMELLGRLALHEGDTTGFAAIAHTVADMDNAAHDVLVRLAEYSAAQNLPVTDVLLARLEQLRESPRIAVLRARRLHEAERTQDAVEMVNHAVAEAQPPDRLKALRLRAAFLASIGHETADASLHELVSHESVTADALTFALSQPLIWQDHELARQGVERLEMLAGKHAPRVILARAGLILEHQHGDSKAMAEARFLVDALLQRLPEFAAAHRLMAQLHLAGSQPNRRLAIKHLTRAVQSAGQPQPAVLMQLIDQLHHNGQFAEAEQYLHMLTAAASNNVSLRDAVAARYAAQGDILRSIELLAAETSPPSRARQRVLAAQLHRAGRSNDAVTMLRALLHEDYDATTCLLAATVLADLDQHAEARALISDYPIEEAEDEQVQALLLGRYYRHVGNAPKAGEMFAHAASLNEHNIDAWRELASLALDQGDLQTAIDAASRGLDVASEDFELAGTFIAAGIGLGGESREKARDYLQSTAALSSAMTDTLTLLDRATSDQGETITTRRNLAAARELVRNHPRTMPAWSLAVRLHVDADLHDEAVQLATDAAARMPHSAAPARLATQLLISQQRHAEARDMAMLWRNRSMQRPFEADITLAALDLQFTRPCSAAERLAPHATAIMQRAANEQDYRPLLLKSLLHCGDVDRAVTHFQPLLGDSRWQQVWLDHAISADGDDAHRALVAIEPHIERGPMLLSLAAAIVRVASNTSDDNALRRASALAHRAAARDESLAADALSLQGQCADLRGDFASAESLYRQALQLKPAHVLTLNNLASLLANQQRNCEEAAAFIVQAQSLAPDVVEIFDTHAQVLMCLEEYDEAHRNIRRALETQPAHPEFLLTLAQIQARQQQWDELRETLAALDKTLAEQSVSPRLQTRIDTFRAEVHSAQSSSTEQRGLRSASLQ